MWSETNERAITKPNRDKELRSTCRKDEIGAMQTWIWNISRSLQIAVHFGDSMNFKDVMESAWLNQSVYWIESYLVYRNFVEFSQYTPTNRDSRSLRYSEVPERSYRRRSQRSLLCHPKSWNGPCGSRLSRLMVIIAVASLTEHCLVKRFSFR